MLPKLPYKSAKRAREVTAFLGLNRTEGARDGEVRDAQNLSTAEYPALTTRGARTAVTGYTDPTDLFEWDGHLVVVDGGALKYDGVSIGEVNPGKKQFAVVNTKLCVFPDKVYIDLTNNAFGHLDAELTTGTAAGSVTITDDSIAATVTQTVKQNDSIYDCWYLGTGGRPISTGFAVYTYGVDPAGVAACWQNGAWDMTALAALQHYKSFAGRAAADGFLSVGDILIPNCCSTPTRYIPVCGYDNGGELPDTTKYNTDGYYMVVTSTVYADDDANCSFRASVYRVGTGNVLFSGTFKVGDAVDLSGTRFGVADAQHVVITSIDDTANKLTFAAGAINAPLAYYVAAADIPANTVIRLYKSNPSSFNAYFTPAATIQEGRVLWVTSDMDYVHVWNPETKREEALYTAASTGTQDKSYTATLYDPLPETDGQRSPIRIARSVPDLDFVCAKDNRLWGVSNSQTNEAYNAETGRVETFTSRVIYASALGDPCNWWVFQGTDTDSWQVAVGSEGDFTAITPLDGVCCWKENRLHKILGSYPSEYYMTERSVDGVAAGCERSCTVVNETLYYVGRNGVFAYSGGAPVNVGYALGDAPKNAVGGTNGRRWYLSGQRGDAFELLTYDLTHRLWMREDATKAEAFACVAGTLYMLAGGQGHCDTGTPPVWVADPNQICMTEQGADAGVQWLAEFAPFGGREARRRRYYRLVLRLDMAAGSSVWAQASCDGGAWETVLAEDPAAAASKVVALPPRRCGTLALRVGGTGVVKLRALERRYQPGSERP